MTTTVDASPHQPVGGSCSCSKSRCVVTCEASFQISSNAPARWLIGHHGRVPAAALHEVVLEDSGCIPSSSWRGMQLCLGERLKMGDCPWFACAAYSETSGELRQATAYRLPQQHGLHGWPRTPAATIPPTLSIQIEPLAGRTDRARAHRPQPSVGRSLEQTTTDDPMFLRFDDERKRSKAKKVVLDSRRPSISQAPAPCLLIGLIGLVRLPSACFCFYSAKTKFKQTCACCGRCAVDRSVIGSAPEKDPV